MSSQTVFYKTPYSRSGSILLKDSGTKVLTLSAPTTLSSGYTLKFPTSVGEYNQVLVNSSTPGTLEWGASSATNEFLDSLFAINNASDTSKKIVFSASSIQTSTMRTIVMPNNDVNLSYLNQDVTSSGAPAFVKVVAAAGSNALPSYTFSDDTDTGMYQVGANNIGISTGGVNKVNIADTALGFTSSMYTTFYNDLDATTTASGSVVLQGGLSVAKTVCPASLKLTNAVTMIDTDTTMAADSDSRLPTQHAARQYVQDMSNLLQNPTGFPNTTDTALSFSNAAPDRTFTISKTGASFSYYINNIRYTKSANESIQISDVSGTHYIYYDGATLSETTTFTSDLILTKVFVAVVYWNKTLAQATLVGDERHGLVMSPATHSNLHVGQGTLYVSGGSPSDFTIGNGNDNSHAHFSVSSCVILDEDLRHTTVTKTASGNINIVYLKTTGGVNEWTLATPQAGCFTSSNAVVYYNQNAGGVYSLQAVSNNNYVLGHVVATNNIDRVLWGILGQNTYPTLTAARTGANNELSSLNLVGLPGPEFVFLATVIYQHSNTYNNTYKCRIIEVSTGVNYVDWRQKTITSTSGLVSDHGNLSGLTDDDHAQYALLNGRATDILKIINPGSVTAPSIAISSSGFSTGFYEKATNVIGITASGREIMAISSSGVLISDTLSCGTNSATTGALSCTSLLSTGTMSCGANAATVGALTCSSISNTGTMSSTGAATMGALTCNTITSSGTVFCGALNSSGGVSGSSFTSSGTFTCGTNAATVGALSCTSLLSTGTMSCGTNSATVGALSCSTITTSGNVVCGGTLTTSGAFLCPQLSMKSNMYEYSCSGSIAGAASGTDVIVRIDFASNSDKDAIMYIIEAVSYETGANTVYSFEPFRTNRALRRVSSAALAQTNILDEAVSGVWTLSDYTTSTTYDIILAKTTTDRTRYYNVHLYVQTLRGALPTITLYTISTGGAV